MIRALLFDLDNTLLRNDMDRFIPAYLAALSRHMAPLFAPDPFIRHLMRATEAMVADTDPWRTNMEVFDAVFFPSLGRSRQELEPLFEDFYVHHFPRLRELTRPDPAARPLVEWAFAQGYQVAVATNPLFPRTAIEQRLAWADVPVSDFPYHWITSYENMHAAKPHPAYYLEIAQRLDRLSEQCLMIGDDWLMDIRPALEIGMSAFWIAAPDQPSPAEEPAPTGQGSLADFGRWLAAQRRQGRSTARS